ncbi:MAG TPA: hypothetical protein VFI27_22750 [candidate division Zixibacteria bacterium]|nr:hypothetical protein [candidate division Zixibacteria bacterium]
MSTKAAAGTSKNLVTFLKSFYIFTYCFDFPGYRRYESADSLELFQAIYKDLRLYVNFFQPVLKLVHKERRGSKVHKRYDEAQIPHQRIIKSPDVSAIDKIRLQHTYLQLNPAALKRQIDARLKRLRRLTR